MSEGRRGGLMDQEPMATIRAHPRRFAIGLPLAFVVPIVLGLAVAGRSLSLAIGLQLGLQTVGLLWLYVPPARARWQAAREARDRQSSGRDGATGEHGARSEG